MKISVAQIEIIPGNIPANLDSVLKAVSQAKEAGAEMVVFPQEPLVGFLADSQFRSEAFLDDRDSAVRKIAESAKGISVVFSYGHAPLVLENGNIHEPSDPYTDSMRYEDIGIVCAGDFLTVYSISTAAHDLASSGAKVIIVPAACRFCKSTRRRQDIFLKNTAKETRLPVVFANCIGTQDSGKTVSVFPGESSVYLPDGDFVRIADPFEKALATVEISEDGKMCGKRGPGESDTAELTVMALRNGVSQMMARLGLRRVVIGVSGGIDSAVSTALYGSILPPEDILLVGMPGPFTSATTRGLGKKLAENLGAHFAEVPIGNAVDLTIREFAGLSTSGANAIATGGLALSPFAIENVQARDRGSRVLAAAASAFGGVVSCNANKDECTIGYGTLHGDILGWLAALGDLWKGEVYETGRILNEKYFGREVIPEGIFKIKPSAELSEKQNVEKGLGDPLDYEYHDALFRAWVEYGYQPEECLEQFLEGNLDTSIGYRGDIGGLFATPADFIADLERWWKLYKGLAVAKRMVAPPAIAISERPFGSISESQTGARFSSCYLSLKSKVTGN